MMKTLTGLCLLAIAWGTNAETITLGQGKLACSAFNKVVNGNFHSPIGALRFHGYISWALGMLSGYNRQAERPLDIDAEKLKMALIDRCGEQPDMPFADTVWQLGEGH